MTNWAFNNLLRLVTILLAIAGIVVTVVFFWSILLRVFLKLEGYAKEQ